MKFFSLLIITIIGAGCVSVNLPKSTGEKAKSIQVAEPTKPFNEISSESADRAWISESLGNTLSYLSDCNNPMDPSLQQIESESLGVLGDLKVLSSRNLTYNGREALETMARGQVDGVAVRMKIMTFKKNNCSYSIVYGGVEKSFDQEMAYYDQFLKGFKAP